MQDEMPSRGAPTRRVPRRRPRGAASEEGWDRPYGRLWGGALIVGFLLPLSYAAGAGSGRYLFVWDLVGQVDSLRLLLLLLPLLLGVTAVVIAGRATPRLRGAVLLLGALLVSVLPVLVSGPVLFGPLANAASLVSIWLVLLLAPPAIAGANRVAKRSGPDPLLRALAGFGGLAMLLILFLPIGPDGTSILGGLFKARGVIGRTAVVWPLILWLLLVLAYAVLAVLYLVPAVSASGIGRWLSVTARFALMGLPATLLLLILLGGRSAADVFFPLLVVLLGGLARLYGVMILMAVGIALVLERAEPRWVPEQVERVFQ